MNEILEKKLEEFKAFSEKINKCEQNLPEQIRVKCTKEEFFEKLRSSATISKIKEIKKSAESSE